MQQAAQSAPQKQNGFASMLTSFSRKLQDDSWDDSGLADDVATLSYEQALSATRRTWGSESIAESEPVGHHGTSEESASSNVEKKYKSASITIRVTTEEQAQLQKRARAAQLSVSAYLRSCIFEAESLRSQVREALAQMQSTQVSTTSPRASAQRGWKRRLLSPWLARSSKGSVDS